MFVNPDSIFSSIPATLPESSPQPSIQPPADQSNTALAAAPSITALEKEQEAKLKTLLLQKSIWLKTLPSVLKPIKMPPLSKHLKIGELMNFLALAIMQHLFPQEILTPEKNHACFTIMAKFSSDPYYEIENITGLYQLIEAGKTRVNSDEIYKNIKQALNFLTKPVGCRGRTAQTLEEILIGIPENTVFCPPELENEGYLNLLTLTKDYIRHTLRWIDKDFNQFKEVLKTGKTTLNLRKKWNDDYEKASHLYEVYKKNKKEVIKILEQCHFFFSQPVLNPNILSPLIGSLIKSLNLVERDVNNIFSFLKGFSKEVVHSKTYIDNKVAKAMQEMGISANMISLILEAGSKETIEQQSLQEDKEYAAVLNHLIETRDLLRALFHEEQEQSNTSLSNLFHEKLKQQKMPSSSKKRLDQTEEAISRKEEMLKDAAPVIDRILKSFSDYSHCFKVVYPLIGFFQTKVTALAKDKEKIILQMEESLFNEEQVKLKKAQKSTLINVKDQEVEELQESSEDDETEIEPEVHPTANVPVTPESITPWTSIQSKMQKSGILEQWKTEKTTPEMMAFSRICFKNAEYHCLQLGSQLKLMQQAKEAHLLQYIPIFAKMLARSCSLITEQLLTARLVLKDSSANLKHYHLLLAENQISKSDHEAWNLINALDGGEIFHRYPHQFARRCKEQKFAIPLALQWILEPKACSFHALFQLAQNTLSFVEKTLPDISSKQLLDSLSVKTKNAYPFAEDFRKIARPIILKLDGGIAKAMQIIAVCGLNEKALWQDVLDKLQGMHLNLEFLNDYPDTEALIGLGDSLLSQAQYVDELIENGLYLQKHGFLLDNHDLLTFRLLKDVPPDEKEKRMAADLNGDYGTQYPYRYEANEKHMPKAIQWRLKAIKYAMTPIDLDIQAIEHETSRKEGFKTVKGKKSYDEIHPVISLHQELFSLLSGIVDLSEMRLTRLADKMSK